MNVIDVAGAGAGWRGPTIVEDHELVLEAPDSWLFVRERRPAGEATGAVLMVHGATLPASVLFDGPSPCRSWLDDLAASGLRAFALDLQGYGRSSRPAAMQAPAAEAAPVMRAEEALPDIDRAVDFVRHRTGQERVDLIGGSWGSITCGMYAAGPGRAKIRRLVLYAPLFAARNDGWLSWIEDPKQPGALHPGLGAYRLVSADDNWRRWKAELDAAGDVSLLDHDVFAALMQAFLATDALAATRQPPAVAVPNGTLADLVKVFTGQPVYCPEDIAAPALLIRGENDPTSTQEDMAGLLARLGSAVKRAVTIGRGTHFISAERHGWQVFDEVRQFLLARDGPAV